MDLLDSGQKFSPRQDQDWDTTLQFLPAADSKQLEKKPGCRRRLWTGAGLLAAAAAVALLSGLLVWHFHLRRDVRVRKLYIGSMEIRNQRFEPAYEDSKSSQFKHLSSLVSRQLKLIYSKNSVLAKNFQGSTVQAFSEGESGADSVVAYYQSEFDVHVLQQDSLDEAIESLEPAAGGQAGRQGRLLLKPADALNVNNVVSQAIDPRMTRSSLFVKKSFNIHVSKPGIVQSPGFPDSSYPPNVYLQWRLRADRGHRVRLDFHTLILEDDCQQDFIKIYDSLAPMDQCVLTEHCGYPHESLSFLSSGNVLLLTLVTSEEKNFPGFRANYSQIPLTQKCGGTLTADRGSFSSPFFPSNYPPKTTCVWSIEASKEKFVKVQFNKFFLGNASSSCRSDYVDVDGQRLCGNKPKSTVITSRSNKMTIKFNSDSSYVDQGFTAEYEAFVPNNPCPGRFQCTNNLCINTTLQCDGWNDCGDGSDEDNCSESTHCLCIRPYNEIYGFSPKFNPNSALKPVSRPASHWSNKSGLIRR